MSLKLKAKINVRKSQDIKSQLIELKLDKKERNNLQVNCSNLQVNCSNIHNDTNIL